MADDPVDVPVPRGTRKSMCGTGMETGKIPCVVENVRTVPMAGGRQLADTTKHLIDRLPGWFGIREANSAYVQSALRLPGFAAWANGEAVGVLLYRRQFPESAEIHLMAVDPSWHRRGIGSALVDSVSAALSADGCQVVQVKTLGPSHSDTGYAATRAFYRGVGFLPLEEIPDLWPGNPCLIMVRPLSSDPLHHGMQRMSGQGRDRSA